MTPEEIHKRIKIINGEKVFDNYLNLAYEKLTSLEPYNLSDVIINGHVYCQGNKLTSLKGAPKQVNGSFICSGNPLTSLEGLPENISGKIVIEKEVLQNLYLKNSLIALLTMQDKFRVV